MKKVGTVVLVSVLVLLMLFTVAPAMVQAAKWTPVTATMVVPGGVFSGIVLNDGGVFFYDATGLGQVSLHTTTADYSLTSLTVSNGTINTKTNKGVLHMNMTWEYIVNNEIVATFEGEVNAKTTTTKYFSSGIPHPAYSTNIYHCVLQGSGLFGGQTLKLDGIRPTQTSGNSGLPISWEGFLLS